MRDSKAFELQQQGKKTGFFLWMASLEKFLWKITRKQKWVSFTHRSICIIPAACRREKSV